MRGILLSFVLVTGFLAGWVVPRPVSSLAEENQGKIVFTSDRDGDDEIYLMNANGSGITRLTNQPGFDAMPDFSPDGKQIVFISSRAGNQEVFVMDADGSNPRQLTETPAREYHPTFSPDGAQIAFMSERDGNVEIYRMNPDGSHVLRLTDAPGFDGQPAFSPDGEQIAFVSSRDESWQIYVMTAEGSAVQRLTQDESTNSYPRFSPDGTQIAYESMSGKDISATELYVMNADGSQTRRLTENDFFDSMPVWSPDGSQFAFVSNRDGDWRLYVMDVDGSHVRPLTTENAHHHDWWHPVAPAVNMPTDAVIAFDSDQDGDREIYLMNGDGSHVQQLTDNAAQDGLPDWSPDGSQLVFFSDRDGDDEIFVMNADGSDPVQLTFNDTQDRAAVWSPDGSRITFVSMRDGNQEIYLMNSDGSDQHRLTDNDRDDFCPDWSPDGTQITFTAVWSSARQDLYVMDVPDDPQVLPEPRLISESAARADWSPDGSKLAFSSNRNGDWEIFVMNSDGSAPQQVTDNRWDDWVPTWSPDGQWLAWAGESRRAEIYLLHLESSTIYQITSNSAQEWRPIWRPAVSEAPAAQPTVLLVFGQQFIPGIYETEVPILEEAGYRVVVASNTSNTLRAKESDLRVDPDLRLQDVRVEDYAAILFNCDNDLTLGTAMPETNRIVQDAVAQGIVLGAICSGPRVLAYAGVVDGLITTGEPSRTCRMLEEQGAICTGAAVERDGLIVTARDRYAASQFTTTVLELLAEQEARHSDYAEIVLYSPV